MNTSQYICQYTSLNVLACILKDKRIKFSKLSSLDDPLEKYVKSFTTDDGVSGIRRIKDFGDFCFISSWSKAPDESIAMWSMYGDNKKGVRIGFPDDNILDRNYDIHKGENNKKTGHYNLLPEIMKELVIPEPIDVDYKRLNSPDGDPSITSKQLDLVLDNLGKYKIKDWEFQREKRFRLFGYIKKDSEGDKPVFFSEESIRKGITPSFGKKIEKDVYFGLSDSAILNIDIIVGPNMSEGDRELLFSLTDKYHIDRSRIRPSKFTDVNSFVLSSGMNVFRNAIEKSKMDFESDEIMCKFPSGCSKDASILLANYFFLNYGKTSINVIGTSGENTHTWLEVDGIIYDITADQYDYSSVYCGKYDSFHNSFSFNNIPTSGIGHESNNEQERLQRLYNTISTNVVDQIK